MPPAGRATAPSAPPSAFSRGYLRAGLPAIYLDRGFGVRFVGSLERVVDPIVTTLDSLPAYFTPELAPDDVLELVAEWLGIELQEAASLDSWRALLGAAGELARARGTARGLERLLDISFPGLALHVEDSGGTTWAADADAPARETPAAFVVSSDQALDDGTRAAVSRAIELVKPVHVDYELRTPAR